MSSGSLIVRLVGDSEFPEFPVAESVGLKVVTLVREGLQRPSSGFSFTDLHGAETAFRFAHVAWARYEPDSDDGVIDVELID